MLTRSWADRSEPHTSLECVAFSSATVFSNDLCSEACVLHCFLIRKTYNMFAFMACVMLVRARAHPSARRVTARWWRSGNVRMRFESMGMVMVVHVFFVRCLYQSLACRWLVCLRTGRRRPVKATSRLLLYSRCRSAPAPRRGSTSMVQVCRRWRRSWRESSVGVYTG